MADPASHSHSITIYEPLDSQSRQIRILKLLPGFFEDKIRCKLSISTLKAPFEALSYVWGDPEDTRTIEVQGETMSVTKSLEKALRHLRDTSKPRDLWVDAVCINQKDNSERTHQVGMMDAIYSEAKRVVVWLGDEQSELALELIKLNGSASDRHWCPRGEEGQDSISTTAQMVHLFTFLKDTKWFTRMWTLQEIILAKSVTYLCGKYVFANGEVDVLIRSFHTHFVQEMCCDILAITQPLGITNMNQEMLVYMQQLTEVAETRGKMASSPFLDIASKFRHRQATDPRDKVFGMLGLTNELTKDIIDYNSSVADIYASTAIRIIEKTGNLDILSHVLPQTWRSPTSCQGGTTSRPSGLASWAPDWSDRRENDSWRLRMLADRESYAHSFRACGQDSTPSLRYSTENLKRLGLKGRFCGTVCQMGPPCVQTEPIDYSLNVIATWRKMAGVDREPEQKYGRVVDSGQQDSTIFDAFWRTLCANVDPFKSTADKVHEADIDTRRNHDAWWWHSLQTIKYRIFVSDETQRSQDYRGSLNFEHHVITASAGRRFFISSTGLFGLAPQDALEGDEIWVVNGGRKPLILRSLSGVEDQDDGRMFTFIGDSYVHGIMYGELVENGTPERPLTLV